MFKFTKKTNERKPIEEIHEKKTSVAGYFLLSILFIFIITTGQTIFKDLSDIPKKPDGPNHCISSILQNHSINNLSNRHICNNFNNIDKLYDLDNYYLKMESKIQEIAALNKTKQNKSNLNERKNINLNKLKNEYNLSLQEEIANEDNRITNKEHLKIQITNLENEISQTKNDINKTENNTKKIANSLAGPIEELRIAHDKANTYYKKQMAFYNFKIFLLKLLFTLPLFLISIFYYLKLKKKNSPYTVITMFVMFGFAILFTQIVLIFLYQILPTNWIVKIFTFLMASIFFRYIVYYSVVILTILLFGGLVYIMQKRIYNPKMSAIRRLKDEKCPNCSYPIDLNFYNFCPRCGEQIKNNCKNCGKSKIIKLDHCPHCGKK